MCIRDSVNIFLSEGAGVAEVVEELKAAGQEVPIDPFGHVQLDKVNPGAWFAKQFAELLGACLLYTSDAADERSSVDLGGRRIIKTKKKRKKKKSERNETQRQSTTHRDLRT